MTGPDQSRLDGLLGRFFSFRGRMSRRDFWRATLILQLAFAPGWLLGLFAILAFGRPGGVVIAVLLPAYLIAVASLTVRRLHDRNRTGWWLAPMVFVPLIGVGVSDSFLHSHNAVLTGAGLALWLMVLLGQLLVFIDIGLRPSVQGPNVFSLSA